MEVRYTNEDMVDFIKYYDEKEEKDCFDTYEKELEDYLEKRLKSKLGSLGFSPKFSKEEIALNIDAIETKIAICDWDNYNKDIYDSPKEQITDLYWLIDKLGKQNKK